MRTSLSKGYTWCDYREEKSTNTSSLVSFFFGHFEERCRFLACTMDTMVLVLLVVVAVFELDLDNTGLVCVLWCWLAFNQESAPELSCVQVDLFGRLSHQESLLLKFRKKLQYILLVVSVWVWLLLKSLLAAIVFSILKEQFDNNKRWERSWKEISSNMITTFVKKVVCSVV